MWTHLKKVIPNLSQPSYIFYFTHIGDIEGVYKEGLLIAATGKAVDAQNLLAHAPSPTLTSPLWPRFH